MKKRILSDTAIEFIHRIRHWETWHWLIKYIPMIPFWIVHCLKARSCWFFTAANPTLTFGGYEGENKMEMYNQLPAGTYPKTIFVPHATSKLNIEALLSKEFSFPVAVKPDVGRMGLMFRKINSLSVLLQYHERMNVDYLLQEYVHYPLEVSVFYYRWLDQQKGTITGFVKKECMSVTGDGVSRLEELMCNYPRVRFRLKEMRIKHASALQKIIPAGVSYILSEALNLSRGGKLVSLEHEKDEDLLAVFDALSHAANFCFGRYDIKCQSIDDLKRGRNFRILEFNGAGAEPHHVYGNGNSIFQAIAILLQHWSVLYKISIANHKKGIPYWSFADGFRHLLKARKHFKTLWSLEFTSAIVSEETRNESRPPITVPEKYVLTADK